MWKAVKGSVAHGPRMAWACFFRQHVRSVNGISRAACHALIILLLGLLNACSTLSTTAPVTVDRNQTYALLAFENLSITPQAEERLRTLLETRLRRKGVSEVFVYAPSQASTLKALLNTQSQKDDAARWAIQRGARYAVSGTVHEWQYQNGATGEPTVGITLSLIDLTTDTVLWQGNASRSGLGYANLSAIADKTVSDLLSQVKFVASYADTDRTRGE